MRRVSVRRPALGPALRIWHPKTDDPAPSGLPLCVHVLLPVDGKPLGDRSRRLESSDVGDGAGTFRLVLDTDSLDLVDSGCFGVGLGVWPFGQIVESAVSVWAAGARGGATGLDTHVSCSSSSQRSLSDMM